MEEVDKYAKIIWDYMHMHQELGKADIILAGGSRDLSTAYRACDLYLAGYAPLIVFSGYHGRESKGTIEKSEAEMYRDVAIARNIPASAILTENKSTNTGENILFSKELVLQKQIKHDKIILVHKPYMERRFFAAFKKVWPEPQVFVTSPQVSYEEYAAKNPYYDKEGIINIMVGDLVRIKEYPKLGYQIEQEIPENVWRAGQELIKLGYDKKLPK